MRNDTGSEGSWRADKTAPLAINPAKIGNVDAQTEVI